MWRIKKRSSQQPGHRIRLTDVLWWTRPNDIFVEIASILGIEAADTRTPGWFALRTKASKNILSRMSDDDRNALENEAERILKEGYPSEVQRK